MFERLDLDGDGNVNRIEMIKALRADTGKLRLIYIYVYEIHCVMLQLR